MAVSRRIAARNRALRQLYSFFPKGGGPGDAVRYNYTSRGELAGASDANGYTANGATCAQLPLQGTGSSGSCSFDARSDAVLSTSFTQSSAGGQPQTTYTLQASQTYHYDSAGREVADDQDGCLDTGTGCTPQTVTSRRTYDGDSHITSQTIPPGFEPGNKSMYSQGPYTNTSTVTQQYMGGPDGHLTAIQGLFVDSTGNDYQSSAQYLWDGDDILLEQQTSAGYINIEKLGFISPSGQINVYDRDWTGTQASSHSSSGFAAWNADPDHWTPADKICEKRGVPVYGW